MRKEISFDMNQKDFIYLTSFQILLKHVLKNFDKVIFVLLFSRGMGRS